MKNEPKVSILAIIRKLKQTTTIKLWKTHKKYLKKYYYKEHTLWSEEYFTYSIGDVSKEAAENNIWNQG
jgi:putative transposase